MAAKKKKIRKREIGGTQGFFQVEADLSRLARSAGPLRHSNPGDNR